MADVLGMKKRQVLDRIQQLRDANILADAKDLTAYTDATSSMKRNMHCLMRFIEIEKFLWKAITETREIYHIKELNESAKKEGIAKCSPDAINRIIEKLEQWKNRIV